MGGPAQRAGQLLQLHRMLSICPLTVSPIAWSVSQATATLNGSVQVYLQVPTIPGLIHWGEPVTADVTQLFGPIRTGEKSSLHTQFGATGRQSSKATALESANRLTTRIFLSSFARKH